MAALTELNLKVPTTSAGCAKWILQQEPAIVAEALSLAELSFNAVRRDISESETSRLLNAHREQIQNLQNQLQDERSKTQQVATDLQSSAEAILAADRARHNAGIEALQRQLHVASEAHRATQALIVEERQNHASVLESEIANLKSRLHSDNAEASKRLSAEIQTLHDDYAKRIKWLKKSALDTETSTRQTLEDENSSLRDNVQNLTMDAAKSLKIELQNLRETYESRISCCQEESKRIIESLEQHVQALTVQASEVRTLQQQSLENSERQLRERFESDHARQSDILRSEIVSLTTDLKNKQGCEALAREEARRHADEFIRAQAISHESSLRELREQIRSLESLRTSDLESRSIELQRRDDIHTRLLNDREAWLKKELVKRDELLVSRDEAIKRASELHQQDVQDFTSRVEAMANKNQELLKNLTGTATSIGFVGENFVNTVFARLNLGTLENVSRSQAEGFADYHWTWTPSNCAPLAAMIDVKLVSVIHSKHDTEKFYKDLSTAVACNRANCGMLMSLNARCPNTRPLHLSVHQGVPVCIISRASNDELSAACMVELGFLAMAQAWPLICRQKGGGDEQTILAAGQHLDAQLLDLEKFMKRVVTIAGLATRMSREAEGMKKNITDMIKGIDVLRQANPQLSPAAVEDDEEYEEYDPVVAEEADWSTTGALSLISSYNIFLKDQAGNAKTHYPKNIAQLRISEDAKAFVESTTNAFEIVGNMVKEQRKLAGASKRKRQKTNEECQEDLHDIIT
jgi:hypothetical protein